MKTLFLRALTILILTPVLFHAQWTSKQSLGPSNSRAMATAFSVNNKIYLVGGSYNFTALAEVWEYDILNDTWTQKSDFPGGTRRSASAFTLGNKGYFMCGSSGSGFFEDVWEYNPATDTWIQKNNFPGGKREEAVGFSIGTKGYLGTGYLEVVGPNSIFISTFNDFWQYDAATDTWTQKANVPGPQRGWAVGAAVGGKGYVGLGGNSNQNGSFNDFYEYDPATDNWTQKPNYTLPVSDAMSFTLGQDVYVCGGINFSNFSGSALLRRFNPFTNSWSSMTNMAGWTTMGAVGLTAANRAFVGTGYTGSITERDDWWEFASSTTLCPSPVSFVTSTMATNGTAQCDGKIIVSNISNGCPPYTVSISGTMTSGPGPSFTISGLCDATYTVSVTDNNCCGTTYSLCVIPGNITSLNEHGIEGSDVLVFPNPSTGNFLISFPGTETQNKNTKVFIQNSLGQEIPFTLNRKDDLYEIEMKEVQKGVYTVFISGDIRVTRKIIVN